MDEKVERNFSFYLSNPYMIGKIIAWMAEEGDGEITVKINGDDEGNIIYSVTGYAEDLMSVQSVYERLLADGERVEAVW